MMMICTPYSKF
uniref:Uncharacterized protein n=1 Tax=Lepeophtheirus salmonis TaxID=72036 RepID=A0A0K2SVB6_LEPSM